MTNSRAINTTLLTLLFLTIFLLGPLQQYNFMTMMPGDIGDARLNNYFLENIYLFFVGKSASLWNLNFFAPFPLVGGYSDNLFGAAPVYMLARAVTGEPDTSFQIWFLFGFVANFFAAYYALRSLGASFPAAAIGASVFAFALPTVAHSGHAQLQYRFGIPLAIAAYVNFLSRGNPWRIIQAGIWLVWQFYCGIYMGFFALLLIAAISATYVGRARWAKSSFNRLKPSSLAREWKTLDQTAKRQWITSAIMLFGLMVLLLIPYVFISIRFDAHRSWGEISSMLPRPYSYFLSDRSWLWSSQLSLFNNLPMRHEHQMFFGLLPWIFSLFGFIAGLRRHDRLSFWLMFGCLFVPVFITTSFFGVSLWVLFFKLPLASAIRAMTRIDLALLFPFAYLVALGVDYLLVKRLIGKAVATFLLGFMIFEFVAIDAPASSKQEWRDRMAAIETMWPITLPEDPIVFVAQNQDPFYALEIDSMWLALNHGVKTMNGYSGMWPPGYNIHYGSNCVEVAVRLKSYLIFEDKPNDIEAYRALRKRLVPIGFGECDDYLDEVPPSITTSDRQYESKEIKEISYELVAIKKNGNKWQVKIRLNNESDITFSSISTLGYSLNLSWRFASMNTPLANGWVTRKKIDFDIPARGHLEVTLPVTVNPDDEGKSLQISLVQEGVFWAHDIGLAPLTIPFKRQHFTK